MRMTHLLRATALVFTAASGIAQAQTSAPPPQVHNRTLTTFTDGARQGFRLDGRDGDGVAYWPGVTLASGTIELDIRGRNVPQSSFVGVAFHGVDANTYEAIYFRPFNFTIADPARRLRAVQYVSHPAHPWEKLRAEHPGVYEKPVTPPPDPDGWFHATIEVNGDTVRVFVGAGPSPVLEVTRLTDRITGWVGLWVGNTSPGDFANVKVTPGATARPAGAR